MPEIDCGNEESREVGHNRKAFVKDVLRGEGVEFDQQMDMRLGHSEKRGL